uniref:Uncharacterized protein n=1 Tax=Cacopsylla melanoneura TaxID=428564 RepID=A0A8D8R7N9_9HEMI
MIPGPYFSTWFYILTYFRETSSKASEVSELHKLIDANGLDHDMKEKSTTLLIMDTDSVPRHGVMEHGNSFNMMKMSEKHASRYLLNEGKFSWKKKLLNNFITFYPLTKLYKLPQ